MKVNVSKLIYGCIITALLSGFAACNGTNSSDKTNDSLSSTSATTKSDDSATSAKRKKNKKRQTYVSGKIADNGKMVKDKDGVYNRAEKAPEFPGGEAALADYINTNLTSPPSAADSGTLRVSFIVDEQGKVLNPQVINGNSLGAELANETLTVFNRMPSWTPGMVHGKNVKTRMELPIRFELTDTD